MTDAVPLDANEFIEQQLNGYLTGIEEAFNADALCLVGLLVDGIERYVRKAVEERRGRAESRGRLVVLLTTDGGYVETVQRLVATIRRHYPEYVGFVVPDHAFSAGTVLVLSGNEIFMDYHARLGPTDPQVRSPKTGRPVPALGYLERYNDLLEKANDGTITTAESVVMVEGFDQAELYLYAQARALSVELVRDWLVAHKFKDWARTDTRGVEVTPEMRTERAQAIAEALCDTGRWHSHAHGIPADVLWQQLELRIEDLDGVPERSKLVKQYDWLLSDYMMKMGYPGILHTVGRLEPHRFA